MAKTPIYAWDASIFIDWLVGNVSTPLDGIAAVIEEVENGSAILITSVTAYSEILAARHTPEQVRQFEMFLTRSNVIPFETSIPIAKKAQQIRSECIASKLKKKVETADATYIAAAIIHKANALHSTDHDMLSLNGHPAVGGLPIFTPRPHNGQKVFGFTD
jgi:predicted nucleic acid-binding protein